MVSVYKSNKRNLFKLPNKDFTGFETPQLGLMRRFDHFISEDKKTAVSLTIQSDSLTCTYRVFHYKLEKLIWHVDDT